MAGASPSCAGSLDADDVAQDVKLRLWGELRRGKTYSVPFRVVVHKVIGWTLKDHYAGTPTHVPLPEGWDPADPEDAHGELLDRTTTRSPPRSRRSPREGRGR